MLLGNTDMNQIPAEIMYSSNHNVMRTVGFLTIMCAATRSEAGSLSWHATKVWNTRPNGVLVFAPPCSSWIFLSTSVTKRSWSSPGGDEGVDVVKLSNIFVRRMIYMPLGRFAYLLSMPSKPLLCCEAWSADSGGATWKLSNPSEVFWPFNVPRFSGFGRPCRNSCSGLGAGYILTYID